MPGRVTAAAWAACAVLLVASLYQITEMRSVIETRREGRSVTTLTSEWESGGIKRTLVSTRQQGETAEAFVARHAEELTAALEEFPKD